MRGGQFIIFERKGKVIISISFEKSNVRVHTDWGEQKLGVTNKTIINRCAKLTKNGFLLPNIVKERVRSYSLSEFAKKNVKIILNQISTWYAKLFDIKKMGELEFFIANCREMC